MALGVVVLVDSALPDSVVEDWKTVARDFGSFASVDVELMTGDQPNLTMLSSSLQAQPKLWQRQSIEANAAPPPPMTSADFIYRPDGRPDWQAMWQGFCELALYGGPPHRGPDNPVRLPELVLDEPQHDYDSIAEIRRGIWETTRLFAERAGPGWLAITCDSEQMSAWMAACIILENVSARCEGEKLFVPASQSFEMKNQIKSVITVLAKVHHYWEAHIAATGIGDTIE